jgi:hypothetical protein
MLDDLKVWLMLVLRPDAAVVVAKAGGLLVGRGVPEAVGRQILLALLACRHHLTLVRVDVFLSLVEPLDIHALAVLPTIPVVPDLPPPLLVGDELAPGRPCIHCAPRQRGIVSE